MPSGSVSQYRLRLGKLAASWKESRSSGARASAEEAQEDAAALLGLAPLGAPQKRSQDAWCKTGKPEDILLDKLSPEDWDTLIYHEDELARARSGGFERHWPPPPPRRRFDADAAFYSPKAQAEVAASAKLQTDALLPLFECLRFSDALMCRAAQISAKQLYRNCALGIPAAFSKPEARADAAPMPPPRAPSSAAALLRFAAERRPGGFASTAAARATVARAAAAAHLSALEPGAARVVQRRPSSAGLVRSSFLARAAGRAPRHDDDSHTPHGPPPLAPGRDGEARPRRRAGAPPAAPLRLGGESALHSGSAVHVNNSQPGYGPQGARQLVGPAPGGKRRERPSSGGADRPPVSRAPRPRETAKSAAAASFTRDAAPRRDRGGTPEERYRVVSEPSIFSQLDYLNLFGSEPQTERDNRLAPGRPPKAPAHKAAA